MSNLLTAKISELPQLQDPFNYYNLAVHGDLSKRINPNIFDHIQLEIE